jgi:hypothetical protein
VPIGSDPGLPRDELSSLAEAVTASAGIPDDPRKSPMDQFPYENTAPKQRVVFRKISLGPIQSLHR